MPRHTDSRDRLIETTSELVWKQSYYGTSVDMICEQCGIKKGSFYHHFPTKQAVVIAALDKQWEFFRRYLDDCFSSSRQPLDRFQAYVQGTYLNQKEHFEKTGVVLGCPLYSLGTEIGTQEPELRAKVDQHLEVMARYFATAIRDAIAQGQIAECDPEALSRQILTFCEGSMSFGRILNSLRPIQEMESGVLRLLGAKVASVAA